MSFSKEVKLEICKTRPADLIRQKARLYGMLLFARKFSSRSIVLNTECQSAARCFSGLLSEYAGVVAETRINISRAKDSPNNVKNEKTENEVRSLYSVSVPDSSDCQKIFEHYGHSSRDISLRINRANIDDESCTADFLSGAFLSCGSVSNPQKDYHLEFAVSHRNLANDLCCLIGEIPEIGVQPRITDRKGCFVVYVKERERIENILIYIGASISAMTVMQNQMVKSVRNLVNRRINSETANSNKAAAAAARQLAAIEFIKNKKGLECLPDELREIAEIRLENPEFNLREIGNTLTPPLSRSGVNHRLKRIIEVAEEIRTNE